MARARASADLDEVRLLGMADKVVQNREPCQLAWERPARGERHGVLFDAGVCRG